jgi:hypothetical protein
MTSTARSAGPTGPAEETSSAAAIGVALACGTLGAVAAWIGWVDFAPALGFPDVSPPGMLNRTLGAAPDAPFGWAVLFGGLAGLAVGYLLAVAKRLSRPGLFSGAIYGLALWFLSGAILMPLMGLLSSDHQVPSADVPTPMPPMTAESPPTLMRETFMMLHLGPRAPIGALIGWLLYGVILGGTSWKLLRRAGAWRGVASGG